MLSLKEFNLDFFIPVQFQEKYKEMAYNNNLSVEEKIVNLLTINPGFMFNSAQNSSEEYYKNYKYNESIKLIREKTKDKKVLDFFALSFNAKPHNKEITNGLIYPDISELLTLVHLNFVFKYINEIYKPGAFLRIASQFVYFRKFNGISYEEGHKMNDMVMKFNSIAMNLTKSNEYIKIFDVYESVEPIKKEFYLMVENRKYDILQNDVDMVDIKKGADYYLNYVINPKHFPNQEAAWNFCLYHALDAAAYVLAIRSMFDTEDGLFKNYSQTIPVETRFQEGSNFTKNSDSVYISFLPGSSTFSYNRLTLKKNEGTWELTTYKEIIEKQAKEMFVKEYSFPLFFKEKEANYGKGV